MNLNKKRLGIYAAILSIGVLIGYVINSGNNQHISTSDNQHINTSDDQTWTCSMHPQIKRNEPGACPICGMDLIPLENGDSDIDPTAVTMSPVAMELAQVQTLTVGKGSSEKSIALTGKVQADERLLYTQSSHIPGRIEKLAVNFTGEFITEGQVIAHVYSPALVTAQEELFEAKKIRETQPALFNAAKEKLKNWKLTDRQIEQILTSEKAVEEFPVLSDVSGYVTKKMVNRGDYIEQGRPIYEIADLSKVWVLFEVYESDMRGIRKGAKVEYTVQSIPGETFSGTVSYIDPVIDPNTRVAKARVESDNKNFALKPEMFVNGTVESKSPSDDSTLTVPKSAVMWTGKRSVVYVMQKSDNAVSFRMREVTLGSNLGEQYVIESGLEVGEEIAVNGTFSIDAAAQLAGKPSMMNPEGDGPKPGHDHGGGKKDATEKTSVASRIASVSAEAKEALKPLFDEYFNLKSALADDDFEKAREAGKAMVKSLDAIDMGLFKGEAHDVWMKQSASLKESSEHIGHMEDLEKLRKNFIGISNAMIAMAESFDSVSSDVYIQHCPMADSNNGADWLSREKEIRNPYFGASMLTCGKVTKEL